ncbi:hypothetical protein [Nonomuraea sp. NPDC048916]|uniref:hypothetical protein n=1 Tax=Nonomuraea sp. NPDC048916 TaxID=3154232 RepID=UPI0033DFB6E7
MDTTSVQEPTGQPSCVRDCVVREPAGNLIHGTALSRPATAATIRTDGTVTEPRTTPVASPRPTPPIRWTAECRHDRAREREPDVLLEAG